MTELKGVYTAIITPFSNGAVDFHKLKGLIKAQLDAGVDGIVPVGTTGESPTLSVEEHMEVIETTISVSSGRCKVIAGTGANSTAEAIELTAAAKKAGADASLQVTPYYNKPTQEGLYRHFSIIAEKGGLPVVLYNVPGRSGVPIAVETVARLSSCANVIAVKEAGGSAERVSAILDLCEIDVLSGDDALTLPMMALGAKGVISVASNIIPAEIKAMVDAFNNGNPAAALKIHRKYYRFMKDLFIETNPIPIKTAMAYKGLVKGEYRLPLCPISEANGKILRETMQRVGLI